MSCSDCNNNGLMTYAVKFLNFIVLINSIVIILIVATLWGTSVEPLEYGDKTVPELKIQCDNIDGYFQEYHLVTSIGVGSRPVGRYVRCFSDYGRHELFDLPLTKWVLVKK